MSSENRILFSLSVSLVALIILKPQISQNLQNFLSPQISENYYELLRKESAELKTEIALLTNAGNQIATEHKNNINAVVYSRYPFNFRNEMVVGAGTTNGVAVGDSVVFGKSLLGEIKEVSKNQSLVRTVFDSDFEISVHVGTRGYDALFRGGLEPILELIPKDANIKTGDAIYSASPNFPYGLALGVVGDITLSGDNFFQEAKVKIPHDINFIKTVSIILSL